MLIHLPVRDYDSYGRGRFGAQRGDRVHNGQDYACYPGTEITLPFDGQVTKIGYPYEDDLDFRYVQVSDRDGLRHRFFYVSPLLDLGDIVLANKTLIGKVQHISERYPINRRHPRGMINHTHYEIMDPYNNTIFLDPITFLAKWK